MPVTPTPEWVNLQEELSRISYLAVKTESADFAGVLKLAEYLNLWALDAHKTFGTWAATLRLQTGQLIKGLKAGRPSQQGLERILRAILEADKDLNREAEKSDIPVPGREVLVFEPEPAAPKAGEPNGFLTVKMDDLPGFKDFLQEVPTHFSAIERGLLQTGGAEKWDVLQIYRPIHTLKSLFGYLGFAGLSDLCHEGEGHLEPYKRSGSRPTSREVESLLELLDLCRVQVDRIKEGMGQGRIEICPITHLFRNKVSSSDAPEKKMAMPVPAKEAEVREDFESPLNRESGVMRIETAKMDELMETLEEWMTCQTQVQMRVLDWAETAPLKGSIDRMGKLARKLQDQTVSLRMVPIQPLFVRIGRVIRDLSLKTGKPVRLQFEGGETHLDKRLVDELWEPVLHLVRNAVDHGLEAAEERVKKGKDGRGGLWIKAWQQEGHFIFSIRDDGKGLDLSKIEKKAKSLGWVEEGADLEPSEWQEMIFRPGFSTMDKPTDVSGRGIGLDLVKRRILSLKGSVETATMPGEGCLFILRIPLTLALLEGLLVRAGKGLYLIPLSQIKKFFLMENDKGAASSLSGEGVLCLHLAEWFGRKRDQGSPVVIQLDAERPSIFLLVDEIFGKREVVLKGLNPLLANLPAVNGGAILGDGQVALVLDIPSLIREISRASYGQDDTPRLGGRGAA